MKPPTIALLVVALLAVGLISWRYSANNKPAPTRMKSIASLSNPAPPSAASSPVSNSSDSEPLAKKLPRLAPAKISELETQATGLVKKMNVADLDPQIPAQHFEEWFRNTMGPEESYTWELNDCGEATGDPDIDKQRDMPLCVEARAQSPPDIEIETSVILQVGTQRQGFFAKPVLRAIVQQEGEELIDIKHLHDLSEPHPVN